MWIKAIQGEKNYLFPHVLEQADIPVQKHRHRPLEVDHKAKGDMQNFVSSDNINDLGFRNMLLDSTQKACFWKE